MCLMYKFAPQFIEEGRLCWLRSPLYVVTANRKEYYYFSDEEYLARSVKGTTARMKGLGALSPEQAHASMFTPEFQRLEVLRPDKESFDLLLDLMGKDSEPKRDFIWKNIDFEEIKE